VRANWPDHASRISLLAVSGAVSAPFKVRQFMNLPPEDDRSAVSQAYAWATRVMVIAAEMVAPGLFGLWIDQKLHTMVLFALLGFALGITVAIMHLVRMTKSDNNSKTSGDHKSLQ
jgi:F0F1-type ATP synthase assembly protein I